MKETRKRLLAILALLLSPMAANANPIVYDINELFGGGSVFGSITTDGTLGAYSDASHFIDWSITIDDGTTSQTLDFANSDWIWTQVLFTATAQELTWDHTSDGAMILFSSNRVGFLCFEGVFDGCNGYPGTINFEVERNGLRGPNISDARDVTTFAAVPEPATLALFGLGLLGLGFARRRA